MVSRYVLISGPARAGKDTLASAICLSNVWPIPMYRDAFAAPIKAMLSVLLGRQYTMGDLERMKEEDTPVPELLGKTIRYAAQTLGTEWGRDHIGPDIWAALLVSRNKVMPAMGQVVSDTRFPNEVEYVRKHGGGYVYHVHICHPYKDQRGIGQEHRSERHLDELREMADFVIDSRDWDAYEYAARIFDSGREQLQL